MSPYIFIALALMMPVASAVEPELSEVPPVETVSVAADRGFKERVGGPGTKCIAPGPTSVRAMGRYLDSGCPKTKNLPGGHYVSVDGSGGACTVAASCNDGSVISCSAGGGGVAAWCLADRDNGDGHIVLLQQHPELLTEAVEELRREHKEPCSWASYCVAG